MATLKKGHGETGKKAKCTILTKTEISGARIVTATADAKEAMTDEIANVIGIGMDGITMVDGRVHHLLRTEEGTKTDDGMTEDGRARERGHQSTRGTGSAVGSLWTEYVFHPHCPPIRAAAHLLLHHY